ncbi:MAG: hypothetical protein AAFN93_17710 [Bacteroidota bacterium]
MKGKITISLGLLCLFTSLQAQDLSNPENLKDIYLTGGMSARFIGYNASGIPDRRRPFTYVLGANATVNALDWSVPFSFTYSNQQYVFSQPFNQFGLSPTYKWATLHLGYRNINFSPYTLSGHQMLGAGFEVKPGRFRVSFISGRLRRVVRQDTTLLSARRPVYKRKGWAARVGYATAQNNIDLIVLKAKDDEGSLEFPETQQLETAQDQVLPGENLVIGINARQLILKRLTLNVDAASSIFVRDRRLEEISRDDLPKIARWFGGLVNANTSTQVNNSIKTGLSYGQKTFNIKGYFLRIDPDYESMGSYFINNDLLAYNLSTTVRLFQGRVSLNGAITRQEDNLRSQKSSTNRRVLPAAGIQVIPFPNMGFGMQYTNYTSLQLEGNLPLDNALKTDQQNPILNFNAYYQRADTIKSHIVSASLSRAELIDDNLLTREFTQYVGNTFNLTYSFSHVPSGLGVNLSYNNNQLKSFNGDLPGSGYSIGGSKNWEDLGIQANLNISFSRQSGTNSNSINGGVTLSRKIHSVSLNINRLNTVLQESDIKEFTIYTMYSVRFNTKKKKG